LTAPVKVPDHRRPEHGRLAMSGISRRWALKGSLAAGIAGIAPAAPAQPAGQEIEIGAGERAAMAAAAAAVAAAADAFLKEYDVPGVSVALARNGRLVFAQGFGVADKKTGEKVTSTHRFRIASVSKPITSVAIFSLVEQGRLALTDRVFGTGGILTDFDVRSRNFVEELTIEDLLTHASGAWGNGPDDPMAMNDGMNRHELIAWTLANMPLVTRPGFTFNYSNFGYCLLGRVIEKISGQPYDAYVRGSVLARCGITEMAIAGSTPAERATGEAVYYHRTHDPYATNMPRIDSSGGWMASAPDLVRFATHVDGLPDIPNILRPATITIMTTPSPVHPRYARGWGNVAGSWWHDGLLFGTTSVMALTQTGFCWAALANSSRENSYRGLDIMVRTMLRSVDGWSDQIGAEPFRARAGPTRKYRADDVGLFHPHRRLGDREREIW
jgi:CubicO group peptidase (beta-lactamase class C family)